MEVEVIMTKSRPAESIDKGAVISKEDTSDIHLTAFSIMKEIRGTIEKYKLAGLAKFEVLNQRIVIAGFHHKRDHYN